MEDTARNEIIADVYVQTFEKGIEVRLEQLSGYCLCFLRFAMSTNRKT